MQQGKLDEAAKQLERAEEVCRQQPADPVLRSAAGLPEEGLQGSPGSCRSRCCSRRRTTRACCSWPARSNCSWARWPRPRSTCRRRCSWRPQLRAGAAPADRDLPALGPVGQGPDRAERRHRQGRHRPRRCTALAGEVLPAERRCQEGRGILRQGTEARPRQRQEAHRAGHHPPGRRASGECAIDELQDIAASDTGATADLALISAHLRRKEFDKALAAIDKLEAKQPDKPLAANLRGRIQLAQKDNAGGAQELRAGAERSTPTSLPPRPAWRRWTWPTRSPTTRRSASRRCWRRTRRTGRRCWRWRNWPPARRRRQGRDRRRC